MILEKQTEATIIEEGTSQESIGMSLDLDSAQVLMQMLSKNLYSDDIGSTIRECASNALDSHRRAGVHMPIIVSLKPAENSYNYEFTVEDFGVGLDADDVKNIISKYGKSTKRNSATELGMMGLGFKAPLAYSSSFYFVCRKDGMERKYMMYEGEDVNTIDLLYEQETAEGNGVKVIIPIKNTDKYQFMRKIKEQLCYFESVYFDVPDDASITNGFVIARHTHFQFSELSTDQYLHICLDNVYYPLDFEKLGISRIQFPIGLRFSLSDGLYPTPNRESLRYTKEAKEIIMEKLKIVGDYYIEKYNSTIESGTDITSLINYFENRGKYVQLGNGKTVDINPFVQFSKIPLVSPSIDGIVLSDISKLYKETRNYWLSDYSQKFELRNNRMMDLNKGYSYGFNVPNIALGKAQGYVYTDKISQLKKDYLRHISNPSNYVNLIKPNAPKILGQGGNFSLNSYYHLLKLNLYPKSEWRTRIQEYQHIVGLLTKDFIDLDALEVPEDFIEDRKKVKLKTSVKLTPSKRLKIQGEIVAKIGEPLLRYSGGRNCKFDSKIYKLEDLHKAKHLKVYAKHDEYMKLDALYGMMSKQKMQVLTFSDRELKIVNTLDIHNLISYDKFMEGKTAPFKRIVTSLLIHKLMSDYTYVFHKRECLKYTSVDLYDKLKALTAYVSANVPADKDANLFDAMLAVATEHNLFDMNIYPEYLEMVDILNKLSFLNPLCQSMGYYNETDEMVGVVTDLFKYYKHKVDLKHYKLRLTEEVLTEEEVDRLLE